MTRVGGGADEVLRGLRSGARARIAVSVLVLLAAAGVGLAFGPTSVSFSDTLKVILSHLTWLDLTSDVSVSTQNIVWQVRLPRVLLAGVVGGTLAMTGAAYQGVFRNPLADPYLIGVATGGALGATIVITSGASWSWNGLSVLPLAAFAGALSSVVIVYSVARTGGAVPTTSLILAGVAVASLTTAVTSYLMIKDTTSAGAVLSVVLGGFNTATWTKLVWVLPYAVLGAAVILAHARVINVLALDGDQARLLGVDVDRTNLLLLGAASLAAAAAVSVAGVIGFVGLIVPHAIRLVWGPDNRLLLPMCLLWGATFMIAADLVARTADAPAEIPVGIITAVCGVPFFLLLLRRSRVGAAW
ncbi:MAG: iron ABC transporter permease [Dehalococcoidia bacterium]